MTLKIRRLLMRKGGKIMERVIAAEHFADNTSWQIYKNLINLHQTKDLNFLIRAHELGGGASLDNNQNME